ncbi:MAG: hypothetical protein ABI539_04370 [Acidobacteriota bacterium]
MTNEINSTPDETAVKTMNDDENPIVLAGRRHCGLCFINASPLRQHLFVRGVQLCLGCLKSVGCLIERLPRNIAFTE